MTVKELIEVLSKLPGVMPVFVWDGLDGDYVPVVRVNVGDDGSEVFIESDSD